MQENIYANHSVHFPIAEDTSKSPYVISSAYRTLQILLGFASAPYNFSFSELVECSGLERNQLYRSLKTLEEAGLIEVNKDGRYTLTTLVYALSSACIHAQQHSIVNISQPYLNELVAVTQESVNLFIRVGDMAVCVDCRDSPKQVRLASVLGMSVPLHAGAVPKALLAWLPTEQQEMILKQLSDLPAYTTKTIRDADALRNELLLIRTRGYSISDEDYDLSARGIGVAIFDQNQQAIAGISVGGPSFRVDDSMLESFAELAIQAAAEISRHISYSS